MNKLYVNDTSSNQSHKVKEATAIGLTINSAKTTVVTFTRRMKLANLETI